MSPYHSQEMKSRLTLIGLIVGGFLFWIGALAGLYLVIERFAR